MNNSSQTFLDRVLEQVEQDATVAAINTIADFEAQQLCGLNAVQGFVMVGPKFSEDDKKQVIRQHVEAAKQRLADFLRNAASSKGSNNRVFL